MGTLNLVFQSQVCSHSFLTDYHTLTTLNIFFIDTSTLKQAHQSLYTFQDDYADIC